MYRNDCEPTALKPVRTVAPSTEPVTIEELKSHARALGFDDDDSDLRGYLDAAIEHLDGYAGILGRALITQTWRQDFDGFGLMRLPLEPLQSVSSVKYYDGANVLQTLTSDAYTVVTDDRSPVVRMAYGQTWPAVFARPDAVQVLFVVGYGSASTDVPSRLRSAIKLHAAEMYKNREISSAEQSYENDTYRRLIKPFERVYN